MKRPVLGNIPIFPGEGYVNELDSIFNSDANPEVYVFNTYDSGKIRKEAIPYIRKSTESGIPAFGIRCTFLDSGRIDISEGKYAMNMKFVMQPEAIKSGLIPLQMYPPEIIEMSEKFHEFVQNNPFYKRVGKKRLKPFPDVNPSNDFFYEKFKHFPMIENSNNVVMTLNPVATFERISKGFTEIVERYEDYYERIEQAMSMFSSPEFNERVKEARRKEGLTE